MNKFAIYLVGGAVAAALAASSSWAQTATSTSISADQNDDRPTAQAPTLSTIIVTAQRRQEDIQKVPVAVTALTGEQLRNDHIETALALQGQVPSLNVTTTTTRNDYTISIRGMGPSPVQAAGAGGGTGVSAYFAEAPTDASGPGLFFDLANVQVLKGPQGTLFGKNTTGGAVLFTPMKPTNQFGGYGEIAAGDFGLKEATAVINMPLVADKLLVRIAAQRYERSGFTVDRGPNFSGRQYDNSDYWAARLSVVFSPVDWLENYTIFNALRITDNGDGYVLSAVNPTGPASVLLPFFAQQAAGVRSTAYSVNEIDGRYDYGVFNTTTLKISDSVKAKNIFSYQVRKLDNRNDIDASPFVIDDLIGPQGGGWHLQDGTYTEELQFQGDALAQRLRWTVGGYWEYGRNIAPEPYGLKSAMGAFTLIQPDGPHSEHSSAGYAQGTYDLGGISDSLAGLKFTAGYRYTRDSFMYGLAAYSPELGNGCLTGPGVYPQVNCLFTASGRSHGQSWTLGLDYAIRPRTLLYVRSGHGYIPGGFNPAIGLIPGGTTAPQFGFKPETDIDVELGVKSTFSIGEAPTEIAADVFHTDFTDIQRLVSETIFTGVSSGFTANASQAQIDGFEFQGKIALLRGLRLDATYSYNSARYTKIDPAAAPSLLGIPFANLPRHQASLGADYTLPLSAAVGEVAFHASYTYQSRFFSAPVVQPLAYIGGYGLLNLQLSWDDIMRSRMTATAFVTNATDRTYRVGQNNNYFSDGFITSFYGEPRMFGLSLRYSFGP